jgi:hypothetical protein
MVAVLSLEIGWLKQLSGLSDFGSVGENKPFEWLRNNSCFLGKVSKASKIIFPSIPSSSIGKDT